MSSLMDFLGQIEKLAYSLAMWVILIPKTIIKIVLDPGWVRDYVAKEFKESAAAKDDKSADKVRFDDYISPVILLLLCSLVPFVGMQLLPSYGLTYVDGESIHGTKTCTKNNPCTFHVEGNFLGESSGYSVQWQCRDESYTEAQAITGTSIKDSPYTLSNDGTCTWDTPGQKQVYAAVVLADGTLLDENYLDVEVKESADTTATPPSATNGTDENQIKAANEQRADQAKDLLNGVKNSSYLGIIFLLPALVFSLVVSGLRDENQERKTISAESLKEVFYAQCYYFTPISLVTYLLVYGIYFSSSTVLGTDGLLVLAFLALCIWFYRAEVEAVYKERKLTSKLQAHMLVLGTLLVIGIVSLVALVVSSDPEMLRKWSYGLVRWGILLALLYAVFGRRVVTWWNNRKKDKKEPVTAQG